MSSNLYIKIDGIDGECTVKGFEKNIEVLNFSYSCNQPAAEAGSGTVPASGRASGGTFNVAKYTDLATGRICEYLWSRQTIPNVIFTATTNNGGGVLKYLIITMSNVIIANFSLHGGGGSIANEEISLSFSAIKVEYAQHDENGAGKGLSVIGWDFAADAEST